MICKMYFSLNDTFIFEGHSAKFGSYSMMDLRSNTIIDIQLVQVSSKVCSVFKLTNLCLTSAFKNHFV